jgi:NAD(P)-dependent dehydrogenase (short-subunit alcohol dehydrogenase family)
MTGLFDLTDKVAWVVGGGGYLGRPICQGLARHGATVVVADQRQESAEEAAAAIRNAGGRAEACQLNAVDEQAVARAFGDGLQRLGRFDILVNTTTWSTGKAMDQMSLAEWEAGTHVSLGGAFVLAREAGRLMAPQGRGSIILFGSMYGVVSPDPRIYEGRLPVNPPDYGAAKAGVLQLVRYQAVMLGPCGVRVNAVVPGPFPNPAGMGTHAWFLDRLSDRVPMGRVGRAEEIVGAVVYLASDAASYVTGTSLVVDGGWTAW